MKRTVEAPELWTPQQAADYLLTTPNALRLLRAKKRGPKYVKAGHRVLYRAQDVLDWLEEGAA
ncbi:helix-turn-helix domain-containing protein [Dietzia sp. WMMA184]|uniref:helix-turn-helix domain-containing protein n=1 Tax=Dietzia sp. WMMA184 TaxID=2039808 RepID=UPI000BDF8293|nr:helix-turn-helix domain-containing protein [Dietzia sp. WMMA184]